MRAEFSFALAFALYAKRLTVCVTGAGAGVDSAWEQKKLEASLPWRARPGKNACLHLAAGTGETAQNPQRPVHAVLGLCRDCNTMILIVS